MKMKAPLHFEVEPAMKKLAARWRELLAEAHAADPEDRFIAAQAIFVEVNLALARGELTALNAGFGHNDIAAAAGAMVGCWVKDRSSGLQLAFLDAFDEALSVDRSTLQDVTITAIEGGRA